MVVKGSDSRKRVSLVRGNVAQSIVDQGRGVCVLSAEVQEAGRLGLRSAARQPSVGEVVRFEDVSNANGRHGCHRGRLSARRHARERRRTRRYETAWRLLEDSRSSAAAAPSGPSHYRMSGACIGVMQVCSSEASGAQPSVCDGGGQLVCSSVAAEDARVRSARACSPEASGVNSEVEPSHIGEERGEPTCSLEASRVAPSHVGEDGARGVFVAPICSSDAAEGFASSDASEGVIGSEASECAQGDAEGDRGGTGGDRSGADLFAGLATTGVEPVGVEVCTGCDIEAQDARRHAAQVIQQRWRGGRPRTMGLTSIERGWVGVRARQLGALSAHVTFLQYLFRRSRELQPGCWRRGGMTGVRCSLLLKSV